MWLSSTSIVGVGKTSNEKERGAWVADAAQVLANDWGTELRMRGHGLTPGCKDLIASINGMVGSSVSIQESELLRSDSLEDEEAWEGSNGGKLLELVRASSKTVYCRWRRYFTCDSRACWCGWESSSCAEAWWSVTGTVLPHDSRR